MGIVFWVLAALIDLSPLILRTLGESACVLVCGSGPTRLALFYNSMIGLQRGVVAHADGHMFVPIYNHLKLQHTGLGVYSPLEPSTRTFNLAQGGGEKKIPGTGVQLFF